MKIALNKVEDNFIVQSLEEDNSVVCELSMNMEETIDYLKFLENQLKEQPEQVTINNAICLSYDVSCNFYQFFSNLVDRELTGEIIGSSSNNFSDLNPQNN
jgi:hypothetical protein